MWSGLFRVEGLEVWRVRPRSEFLEVQPWSSSSMPSITGGLNGAPARRFLADPHEIGRFEGIGPDFVGVGSGVDQGQRRQRAGHCRRLWERRLELGANTYGVLVHPTSTTSLLASSCSSSPMGSEGM